MSLSLSSHGEQVPLVSLGFSSPPLKARPFAFWTQLIITKQNNHCQAPLKQLNWICVLIFFFPPSHKSGAISFALQLPLIDCSARRCRSRVPLALDARQSPFLSKQSPSLFHVRHSSSSQIVVWLEELFDRGSRRKRRQERDYGIVIDSQRKLARGKKWNKYRFTVCRHTDMFFSRTGLLSYQTLPATNHLFKQTKANALCCLFLPEWNRYLSPPANMLLWASLKCLSRLVHFQRIRGKKKKNNHEGVLFFHPHLFFWNIIRSLVSLCLQL